LVGTRAPAAPFGKFAFLAHLPPRLFADRRNVTDFEPTHCFFSASECAQTHTHTSGTACDIQTLCVGIFAHAFRGEIEVL
jgi:hypothetical protein